MEIPGENLILDLKFSGDITHRVVVQIPDGAGEHGSLADEGGDVVGRGAGVDPELAWEGAWGGGGGAQGVGHQAALPTLGLVVEVNAGF